MATADIVIVGAGVIGLCSALALSRRTSARIVVLEKGAGPGEGSSGASSAICRCRYSLDEMVILAREGVAAYRDWGAFTGLAQPLGRLQADGVLWLGDTEAAPARAARLRSLGVDALTLDRDDLRVRFPAINPCGLAPDLETGEDHACVPSHGPWLFEADGGYFDPSAALADLIVAVRSRGVEVRFGARVTGVDVASGEVTGVRLADGASIACGAVLNAAGPWCNALLGDFGLAQRWSLAPTRIQIALVDRPETVSGPIPVCADLVGGIYFRSEAAGRRIVLGSILPQDEREDAPDPDRLDRTADDDFVNRRLHALQHRLIGLGTLRNVGGYSGLYTMNRRDLHPVVGATAIGGFFVANGFTGHGFKLAPAVGALVAGAMSGVRLPADPDIDPALLAFDRDPLTGDFEGVLA